MTQFQKGHPGGPGRPKGMKNGEGRKAKQTKEFAAEADRYDYNDDTRQRFAAGNPGRPKGSKNKLSLHAVEKMVELGLDPIEQYVDLLERAKAAGNLNVEANCLSVLAKYRYSSMSASDISNPEDEDLQINVTSFDQPGVATVATVAVAGWGKNEEAKVTETQKPMETLENSNRHMETSGKSSTYDDNVVRIVRYDEAGSN